MSSFILGQVFGGLAVAIALAVYQINDRKRMLQLSTVSATLFAVSFYFLHAYTGAILNLIGGIRNYIFMRSTTRHDSRNTFLIFAVISAVATLVTWAGPISLLAYFGTLFSGMASGQLATKSIRRFALLAPPLWFSYNFLTHSYPGMVIEVFVIISNLIGQYRFDVKPAAKTE